VEQFAGVQALSKPKSKRRRTTLSDLHGSDDSLHLQLRNWDFESLDMSTPQLVTLCVDVMIDFQLDETLHTSRAALSSFVRDVQKLYNDVPFHNFPHAVCVFHSAYMFVLSLDACWSPLECVGVLLASLCHDLDHRGLNNAYHVATMSDLAVRYNDQSVLENHHCASMFALLEKHGLLNKLSQHDIKALRKMMIDMIMGTDMTRHAAQLAKMEVRDGRRWGVRYVVTL
jgi:high affinity cGMP-specific 3',5'-cyclic phosphodiesterase 9